jgi:hypothetical protein
LLLATTDSSRSTRKMMSVAETSDDAMRAWLQRIIDPA